MDASTQGIHDARDERRLMGIIEGTARWLADPAHWVGPAGIPARTLEHVLLSGAALLIAMAIALPVGIAVGHTGRGTTIAINLANLGRAMPSLAVMGIVVPLTTAINVDAGFKIYPALIALIVLGIPPILVNAHAGVAGVDREVVESGRGMGMTARSLLWRVELPIAVAVIVGGLRSASAQIIATATLAAIFGGPGLGRYLVEGYAQLNYPMMVAGVIFVAVLFLLSELVFAIAQRLLTSPGLKPPTREEIARTEVIAAAG